MKKIIILGLILIPSITFASIDTNLKYGSKGQGVIELQEFLIDSGFLMGQATGNFYSLTLKAVKAFQTAKGLPSTGFVGQLTRAEINKALEADTASSTQAEIQEVPVVVQPVQTPQQQTLGQVVVPTQQTPEDYFNMTIGCRANEDTGKNGVFVEAHPTKGGYGEIHITGDTRYSGGLQITPSVSHHLIGTNGTYSWEANLYEKWSNEDGGYAKGLIATKTGTITCQ